MPQIINDPRVVSRRAFVFGRFLLRRREQLGLSIRAMSHRASLGTATLSSMESGFTNLLGTKLQTFVGISKGYQIRLDALIKRMGLLPEDRDA